MSNARKMLMGGRKVTTFQTSAPASRTTTGQRYVSTGYSRTTSRVYRGQYQEYSTYIETGGYYENYNYTTNWTTYFNTWKYTSW